MSIVTSIFRMLSAILVSWLFVITFCVHIVTNRPSLIADTSSLNFLDQ